MLRVSYGDATALQSTDVVMFALDRKPQDGCGMVGEANNQVAMIRETVSSGLPGLTYSPRVRNRTLWSVLFRLNEVLYFHCAPTNI